MKAENVNKYLKKNFEIYICYSEKSLNQFSQKYIIEMINRQVIVFDILLKYFSIINI